MDLQQALRTSGSVRRFTAEPVDDATIYALLDDARFAPSGGNRQGWRVAVITDADRRQHLGRLMQSVWNEYRQHSDVTTAPFAVIDVDGNPSERPTSAEVPPDVANELIDHITEIPVMLVIAADLRQIAMMDNDLDRPAITGGASIYPFCWNLLLAARARGLGGVITTFLARAEPSAAASIGLPPTSAIAATIFIGHPVHQPTKLRRHPVESFTTIDRFDGPEFRG
ncbi:MAG: nitroreductase family protein [Ilumatobacteraceae bacterium]